jgi:amino acid adenylation domain-containing protein/non-ribosomal peptide synthase protein (TIGR01720 family)
MIPPHLIAALQGHTALHPERVVFTFLPEEEGEPPRHLTYADLERRARAVAQRLAGVAKKGDRALLLYPSGLDFICAFFGCLYAGVIAVPAAPPAPPRLPAKVERLAAVAGDCAPSAVLTTAALASLVAPASAPAALRVPWLSTDALAEGAEPGFVAPPLGPDDLAFLQYTSGSTGAAPKGVMVSHANVVANLEMITAALGVTPETKLVAWLPMFHDMGLIAMILDAFYVGFRSTFMAPHAFLRRPLRWLEEMSRQGADFTGAPNFGYELCAREITEEQKAELDLSRLRIAFSGAEPVRAATLDRFARAFAPCGFSARAFSAGYGLAEATVFVTCARIDAEPSVLRLDPAAIERGEVVDAPGDDAALLVGNGRPWLDGRVLVVDPEEATACPPGRIGEIWVAGSHVARGYWNQPETSAATFGGALRDTGEGPFLRTGDLGFLRDGDLYVAGRRKDLIILHGKNHHPHDIEWTLDEALTKSPAVSSALSAAFSVEAEGDERLVVAIELRKPYQRELARTQEETPSIAPEALAAEIARAVAEAHEIPVHDVLLLAKGALPRTTSGKVQRHACRAGYLAGTLDVVWSSRAARAAAPEPCAPAEGDLPSFLRARLAHHLGVALERIDEGRPLAELGLDSVRALRLTGELEARLGRRLPAHLLWEHPSVGALVAALEQRPALADTASVRRPLVPAPADENAPFPLGEIQEAYWIGRGDATALGNVATFFYVEVDTHGLAVDRLEQAFGRLIARHGMLRAVVAEDGTQRICPDVPPYRIAVEDLRDLPEGERTARLAQLREERSHQLRPAHVWPLFDVHAALLPDGVARLGIGIDLLIADVASIFLLLDEWRRLYLDPDLRLPPLSLSFRDHVLREHAARDDDEHRRSLAYWKARALPPGPELPLARSPASIPRPRFVRHQARLAEETWQRLRARAAAAGVTPSVALCTAYAAVLEAWSASPRFTLNLTLFDRRPDHPQIDALVGDFTSTLLLEIDGTRLDSFATRAQRLTQKLWEDLEHRAVSGVRVARERAQAGETGSFPVVFTSALGIGGLDHAAAAVRGWLGAPVFTVSQTPQVWLDHQAYEDGGALSLSWDAVRDLFPEGMIASMFSAYVGLLAQLADDELTWHRPAHPIPREELAARHALHASTRAEVSRELLHTLFAAQVPRRGAAPAVITTSGTLSYDELFRAANRLGHRLRALGAKPNDLVAVLMHKGWEQIVACLAVLSAGAAYVPLAADLPADRLAHLLAATRARVVLTQSFARPQVPEGIVTLCVDEDPAGGESSLPPVPVQAPTDLAYVIFTSGSTGAPKGVMIDHRGAVNTILDINERFAVGPDARVLALSSLSFDLSVYDLFGTLAAGGAVVLPDASRALDPEHWLDLATRERVTLWNTVPALMTMLVEHAAGCDRPLPDSLRLVLLSGDWIPVTLPAQITRLAPGARVVSLGGATEASIWSILFPVDHVDPTWSRIPYGKPMRNQSFHVLDDRLLPRPVWVSGQLHIGGLGLARGYWDDATKTAASFITHPTTGERLYRTGDLGRYLPDGNIDFLGRDDLQVKVGGHRIEIGEIEHAIAAHPAVRASAVAVREQRLVAYLVPAAPEGGLADAVRTFLADKLPRYMVPRSYVILDALPLSRNGKIDRRALPAPDLAEPSRPFVAPETPAEEAIARIFAEVLGAPRIGAEDDFFALGGHSLLAVRAISRLRVALDVELPLRALFDHPTPRALAAEASSGAAAAAPLVPAPRDGELPLSFAQQRLWFLDQLDPGTAAYHLAAAVRLGGALDAEVLGRVFAEVVRRHEALRTTFPAIDGEPVQRIGPPPPSWALPLTDLAHLPEPEAEARRLAREEAARPFALARDLLLRTALIRLREDEHLLVVVLHHIAADGWSLDVLVHEVGAIYAAFSAGAPSPLPELPLQYADFAAWQRRWLSAERLDAQLAFWKERLAGAPSLELPTDRPRTIASTARSAEHPIAIDADLSAALARLARDRGATLFMALLSAFQVLLARHADQTDVCVGTPVASRSRREVEPLIGFFVNTLVLRADLADDPTFLDLLDRAKTSTLAAFEHEELPFEKLVEALGVPRDTSRAPLVQAMFVLQSAPLDALSLPALRASVEPIPIEVARFDLTLTLTEAGGALAGSLAYDAALFDAETVARLAARFEVLLRAVVANPTLRVGALPLLPSTERERVLAAWSDGGPGSRRTSVLDLFEAQVAARPDATALVFQDERLTYRELHARAGVLARHLHRLGVGPDAIVGVLLPRSIEQVVALLGALTAGAAYLPIDATYPPARIGFMVADSGASVVLTRRGLVDGLDLGAAHAVEVEALSTLAGLGGGKGEHDARRAAYVIYTSGSTGLPKGVLVEHGGLVNLVEAQIRAFGIGPESRVLQFASFGFDASVSEIFTALAAGATLCLAPAEALLPGPDLLRTLVEREIDVVTLPPSALAVLPPHPLPALRTLVVAGEACPAALVDRWAQGRRFLDAYGPTEATVCATFGECHAGGGTPSIGRPLAGVRVYVLDRAGSPAPIGVPGELHIGGAGVARGYLNRPELSAQRFVLDPLSPEPGARMFRSGDRGRWRHDGTIELLGRLDDQVKIRGFRVEPGEIEAALRSCPEVRDAAVIAREDAPGEKRLVGYVATARDVSLDDLRDRLKRTLPAHMVPATLVALPSLPLSPNGKVDRKALPRPEPSLAAGAAPRTPMEELVAGIFADVLGLRDVGADRSFFDLGGHSLLATQVMSRVRSALGVELPLRALFQHPTPVGLAAQIAAARSGAATSPAVEPAPRTGPLPLSFAQQRLWFLDQLDPHSAAYNIPAALRLRGALDAGALARAFAEVVRRHEALRTSFPAEEGEPAQLVQLPPDTWPLPLADLAHQPDPEPEARRLAAEEAARPFDLAHGPLLRTALLRLREHEHLLLVTVHHIVSDGWSTGVLVREIAALYEAFSAGRPSPLPELLLQYADFALWQRSWLSAQRLDAQLTFWKERLAGAPTLELPTDRPRSAARGHRAGEHPLSLSPELTAALLRLSRERGATLFMTLLSAFQVLLARHASQSDVCVGTPVANRNRTEIEPLIGFFVNTLVLRADLADDPTFLDLLERGKTSALAAYEHQDLPFEKLVEALGGARDLDRTPLFQAMFALQNMPLGALRLPGLELAPERLAAGTAKLDLFLTLAERDGALVGELEYDADLFDAATIARLVEHFEVLLAGVVGDPTRRVSALPLLGEAERHRLLVTWNDTTREHGLAPSLPALFEAQAARTPDAVALLFEGEATTFAALEALACRVANHLIALGVTPGARVAVAFERSPEMVAALLGVLETGAAFVPIDPALPRDRVAFMLVDAEPAAVLTQTRLAGALPAESVPVISVDDPEGPVARASSSRPERRDPADDVAYVLYTSGSTGRPKGVCGTHAGAVNRLAWQWEAFPFRAGEVCCQKTTLAFVDAVAEIFAPLLQGVPAVLVPDEVRGDLARLVEILAGARVTRLVVVPSLLAALLDVYPDLSERLPALQRWTTSGETLSAELCERFVRALPGRTLVNLYGCSEVTADVTSFVPTEEPWQGRVPIGRPIDNTRIYLLDPHGEPVPIGVTGEIHVGGANVARGYFGRPELTAERFVPAPFHRGARMFRTGDLGRHLPDGTLEYLGRADLQVKIRGHRIELGEIEQALSAHPAVRAAVVAVREDVPGDLRLVAYLVCRHALTALEARRWLEAQLPAYSVPAAYVFLDALPQTPSGKVDRQALPAPARQAAPSRALPRTPTEELIAAEVAALLRHPTVGVEESFFDLGGHSLLATQLVSRVRSALGVELPLRALFELPTVRGLARRVDEQRGVVAPAAPPIVPVPRAGALPLSFAQQRLWFLDQLDPHGAAYNIPAALRLRGALDAGALSRAFAEVVRRHEALRTAFAMSGAEPAQLVQLPPDTWPLPLVDLAHLPDPEPEARRLAAEEAARPFDLAHGPLLRTALLRLREHEHLLLVTVHHIVSDGWSTGVLVREIAALYEAFSAGRPSPLPELLLQYADFALWQRSWLSAQRLDAQLTFWKERLAGAPTLELPTDRPRSAARGHRAGEHPLSLSPELTAALLRLSRERGATLFMTLLSAFQVLLARHASQSDVCVGTPVANRNRTEIEPLIGFFVNTLVLRADLADDPTFLDLLERGKTSALAAYEHQDLPFEKLVEALGGARDLDRTPLFQAMFALQNMPLGALRLPGLELAPERLAAGTAKLDLFLTLAERDGALVGELEYDADLFDAATIARLVEHFEVLLAGVVGDPTRPVSALLPLDEAEREQLRCAWAEARQLPAPEKPATTTHALPATPVEELLAEQFAAVLRLPSVGVEESFFELGGHSLLAFQVLAAVRAALRVEVPLRAFFEHPTVRGLARRVEDLRRPGTTAPEPAPAIVPAPDHAHAPFPLTDIQMAYWIGRGDSAPLGNVATFGYTEIEARGIDLDRLERACQRVIERHGMLRAVVLSDGTQRVLPEVPPYRIETVDLRDLPEDERAATLAHAREELSHQLRPADVWPLFELRAHLLPDGVARLHFGVDLLIADAASIVMLVGEVRRLYLDPDLHLAPLTLGFRDYVLAEQGLREGDEHRRALAYWRDRARTLPPGPDLPLAQSPASIARPRFVRHRAVLAGETWSRLRSRAAKAGVTPSAALCAAYAAVLATWSKVPRFTLDLTLFNRRPLHPEVNAVLGDFTSIVLLEIDAGHAEPFGALAARLQRQLIEDLEHRALSGVEVLREIGRATGAAPSIPVVFTSTLGMAAGADESAWWGEPVFSVSQTPQVWLDHQIFEAGDRLVLHWDALEALFPEGMIASMFAAYVDLLERLAGDERAFQEPPRLAPARDLSLVREVNATGAPLSSALLHTLFADQVPSRGAAPAVVSPARTLSYAELFQQTNRLARRLRALGARPGDLVAVLMHKGWEQIVACLAILTAGAAYVPIAADLPADRVAHLLAATRARVVLTQSFARVRVPEGFVTLRVDEDPAGDESPEPLASVQAPTDLAYVIFTSGSTGTPKGVMIDHRGAVNTLLDINERFAVGPDDRVLALSSLSFDLSVYDVFGTLAAGGTIILPEADRALDPERWLELVTRQQVTLWNTVPALMTMLVEYAAGRDRSLPDALRLVLLSGDWIPVALPDRIRRLAPGARVVSLGGATEASIWSIFHPITAVDPAWRSIPYGKPLRNQTFHVLDDRLDARPVWVPGQLCIGGVGLALGYWDDAAKTAASFVTHPLTGERLYRTGDMGRWLPDGSIEFLGREDLQVKVGGHRIELGEIDAALELCPGLRRGVAAARAPSGGELQLVAYLVPIAEAHDERRRSVDEVRAFLAAKLPGYMIPRSYVLLDALPLSPNGKIDRKALPAPEASDAPEPDHAPPRNEREAALAEIWAQLLRRDRVGVHDNFFELGGDSILAIQMVSRAARAGLSVAPRQIFEHQTIAALAPLLGRAHAAVAEQGPVTGEAPLAPVQRWFFAQSFADAHHWNQALLLDLARPLAAPVLERAVAALLAQHDALRFRYEGLLPTQRYAAPNDAIPFHVVDISGLPPTAIATRAAEVQASLSLDRGPLFRAVLFQLAQGAARLLLVAHHLVVDGISWRVLVEDLGVACEQAERGRPIALGPKTGSYAAWTRRAEALAAAGHWESERAFWQAVGAATTPLFAPADAESFAADEELVTVEIDERTTASLLRDAGRAYRTEIDDVLLAALGRGVGRSTGRTEVVIACEGHGREVLDDELDVSRTVGWFTAMYPVRLEGVDVDEPGALLKSIKEQLRAVPGRGLGHGWLLARGDLGAARAPDLSFNYLGQLDQALAGGPFRLAEEAVGPLVSPRSRRPHALSVVGHVRGGRLRFAFFFAARVLPRATVTALAESFERALRALIAHCISPEAGGVTPSDFPLAALDQATLDRVVPSARAVEALYPLSPMQEGLLFHGLGSAGDDLYLVQTSFGIRGTLDEALFQRAWQHVVAQHPVLRSAFLWDGLPRPLQRVHRDVACPFARVDLRDVAGAEDARFAELLRADRARGFDYAQPPLMRVTLVALPGDRLRCLWTFHHLLLDGWSLPLVLGAVLRAYVALSEGHSPASRPAARFEDYIAHLERRDRAAEASFWRAHLAGLTPPRPLPLPRPPSEPGPALHRTLVRRLPRAASEALARFARAQRLTLGTVVEGAWALVLGRYLGEEEVAVGTMVAGRPATLAGVEETVGVFVSSLPLRVPVASSAPLVPWLAALQEQLVLLREHESTPLAEIQALGPLGRGRPLFGSLFVFESYPLDGVAEQRVAGLAIEDVHVEQRTNYPLTLTVEPWDGLRLSLGFDAREHAPADMDRLLGHVQVLLGAIAHAAPDTALHALPMLTEEERHRLLVTWNDTAHPDPAPACIHERFAAQVRRAPLAPAVSCGGRTIAYGELDRRSNQLARYLRARGVRTGALVGVAVERSIAMLVGLLGILKAGGAYVPLDPTYPRDRLAFMAEDAGLTVLVTEDALTGLVPAPRAGCVSLDGDADAIGRESDAALDLPPDPDALAYVIYTSGSTGKPKGVEIPHRALASFLRSMAARPGLDSADLVLAVTSLSFDIAGLELWLPLSVGAHVEIVSREVAADGAALRRRLEQGDVTLMQATPSTYRIIVDAGWMGDGRLRALVGGEAVPREIADALCDRAGAVWNMYGPTETTIWSCVHPLTKGAPVRIGRPIADTRVHVLGAGLDLLPVGVPGELYIGGGGLARGYLGRPDLTAERFVPDPFMPGARLYRTGDLCRYHEDGTLECLGRLDFQVKIRGHRVELGEIEAALTEHPAVREAVVIARAAASGAAELCAYVACGEGPAPSPAELRSRLDQKLPRYMVPAAIVALPRLPRLPNGKLDRRALPAPERGAAASTPRVAPRDERERALAAIWTEVLGVPSVGVDDDFFELGGDSILSIQVVSRARRAGLAITPKDVFDHPTVADLARASSAIEGADAAPPPLPDVRLDPRTIPALAPRAHAIEAVYPLSPLQAGMLFHSRLVQGSPVYFEQWSAAVSPTLDVDAFTEAWRRTVARHPALRTSFLHAGVAEPVQVVEREAPIAVAEHDLSGAAGDAEARVEAFLREDRARGFDFERAPLMRIALLRLPGGLRRLVWSSHHALLDGWSLPLVFGEVIEHYESLLAGRPAVLAPAGRYEDFVAHVAHRDAARAEAFWRRQLEGFVTPTPIGDGVAHGTPDPRQATRRVDASTTAKLVAIGRAHRLTPSTLATGAFALLLAHRAGEREVVFGTTVSARSPEIPLAESTVGPFINTLPQRVAVDGEALLLPWLARVQERAMEAQAFALTPLVDVTRWSEMPPGRALFEALLVFESYPVDGLLRERGGALGIEDLRVFEEASYPLVLVVVPGECLELRLSHDAARVAPDDADRLLDQLVTLFQAIAEDPDRAVAALSLVSDDERRALLAAAAPRAPELSDDDVDALLAELLAAEDAP